MKVTKILFVLMVSVFTLSSIEARFLPENLEMPRRQDRAAFNTGAKALIEAIDLPLRQNMLRPKLPGELSPFLEIGYKISDISERDLAPYTSDNDPSSIANSFSAKGGIGLPFGFNISAGVSQSLIEEKLTGLNASIAYQLFDFSTLLFSDFVPAVSLEVSGMRNFSEIGFYTFSGSAIAGIYDRISMLQFGYAVTYQYSLLTVLSPSVSRWFLNHTLVSQFPIVSGLFARTEIGLPHFSGTFVLGYDF